MAGVEYDAYEANEGVAFGGLVNRTLNWFGALSALALVAGLAVWSYQLTIRDVTDVPVIRALEGPMRVQPENPGGQLAQHQGLAVNNVQSAGEAEGPAPQVILAPDPIDLEAEDVMLAEASVEQQQLEIMGTVVSLDVDSEPLSPAESLAEAAEVPEEVEVSALPDRIDPSIPGVNRSPRPDARPKLNLAALRAAGEVAPISVEDVKPEDVPAGTRLVQLGAFDDVKTAQAEWVKISASFEEYMDGKKRLIQEASSGGRKFYRLRAVGFEDLNASRRFCAVLVAGNAACIPVVAR